MKVNEHSGTVTVPVPTEQQLKDRELVFLAAPVVGEMADQARREYCKRLRLTEVVARYSGMLEVSAAGKMVLEYERVPGEDAPDFTTNYCPLLFTHADTKLRKSGGGPDEWEWEPRERVDRDPAVLYAAARHVGELVEKTLCDQVLAAPGAIRVPHDLTPEIVGGEKMYRAGVYDLVHSMLRAAVDKSFYGPYALLCGEHFHRGMDSGVGLGVSLRRAICNISTDPDWDLRLRPDAKPDERVVLGEVRIDSYPPDALVLLQLTSDVVRVVNGLPFRVVPWDVGYKAVTITVGQVRRDWRGNSGVVIAARPETVESDAPVEARAA